MTNKFNLFAIVSMFCLMAAGCSGGDEVSGPTDVQTNICVTPGSTYLVILSEISGDCGSYTSVLNTNQDGTITTEGALVCDREEQDGCTVRGTNCQGYDADSGCSITETFSTTFEADGSEASGVSSIQVECDDGSFCYSTYNTYIERQ